MWPGPRASAAETAAHTAGVVFRAVVADCACGDNDTFTGEIGHVAGLPFVLALNPTRAPGRRPTARTPPGRGRVWVRRSRNRRMTFHQTLVHCAFCFCWHTWLADTPRPGTPTPPPRTETEQRDTEETGTPATGRAAPLAARHPRRARLADPAIALTRWRRAWSPTPHRLSRRP